jgi:hypothetical protein
MASSMDVVLNKINHICRFAQAGWDCMLTSIYEDLALRFGVRNRSKLAQYLW